MKKCTYCGKEYSDETDVCPIDGQPLKIAVPSPASRNTVTNEPAIISSTPYQPKTAEGRGFRIVVRLVVVLLLILAFMYVFGFWANKDIIGEWSECGPQAQVTVRATIGSNTREIVAVIPRITWQLRNDHVCVRDVDTSDRKYAGADGLTRIDGIQHSTEYDNEQHTQWINHWSGSYDDVRGSLKKEEGTWQAEDTETLMISLPSGDFRVHCFMTNVIFLQHGAVMPNAKVMVWEQLSGNLPNAIRSGWDASYRVETPTLILLKQQK